MSLIRPTQRSFFKFFVWTAKTVSPLLKKTHRDPLAWGQLRKIIYSFLFFLKKKMQKKYCFMLLFRLCAFFCVCKGQICVGAYLIFSFRFSSQNNLSLQARGGPTRFMQVNVDGEVWPWIFYHIIRLLFVRPDFKRGDTFFCIIFNRKVNWTLAKLKSTFKPCIVAFMPKWVLDPIFIRTLKACRKNISPFYEDK